MIFLFRIGIVLITFQSGTSCGQRAILVHQVTQSKKLWHSLKVWSVYAISCVLFFNCSDCTIFEWYSVWFSCIINFADVWAKQCKIFMLSWYIINYSQKWFPNEILIITTDIFFCLFSSSILVYVWPFQIPGQRALALHLIFSVLDKALHNINQKPVGSTLGDVNKLDRSTDWEAIWAFALGPEPELVLSLRWIPSECLYCWFPLFYQCMLLYYAFGKLTFIIISSRGIILSLDFH